MQDVNILAPPPINGEKPKEVLILMHTLAGGGAEKVLIDILENFDYSKYKVTLLLIRKEGVYVSRVPRQVRVLSLEDFKCCRPKYIVNRYTVRLYDRCWVNRALGNRKFDTIVSFMEGQSLYFHSLVTDKAKRNISWVHIDLMSKHYTASYFKSDEHERKCYGKMDSVVFVSEKARNQFFKLFDINVHSTVIYNLIDRSAIRDRAVAHNVERSEAFTICNVGRLNMQKRQDRLIEAVSLLKNQYSIYVDAWILGEGELEKQLREHARALNVEEQIKFLGFKDNPYPYMAKADAFVLSSDTEGYPLVLCEAICLGRPVISTNITGASEVLGENCGILCEPSASALAESIRKLASGKSVAEEQSSLSQERSRVFSVPGTMEQIYRVIEGEN